MVTIDSTLEDIMQLDFDSREILLEILQKRQIEARRDEIAKKRKRIVSRLSIREIAGDVRRKSY